MEPDADLTIPVEAMERYNEWRAKKLAGMADLSIQAYNEEQLTYAAIWENGRKAGVAGREAADSPYYSRVR